MAADAAPVVGPVPGLGFRPPTSRLQHLHVSDRGHDEVESAVAEEVPVALVYGGQSHAVMMCSPLDLEDFAVGFTLTEAIAASPGELVSVSVERHSRGVEVRVTLTDLAIDRLARRTRSLVGRTGCGLCGIEAIDDAVRPVVVVGETLTVTRDALFAAGAALQAHQPLNAETRAIHAAAWANPDGTLAVVREDVGRHNALDKVIGALVRSGRSPRDGFIVLTSRASFELVQKAAAVQVELLAAVSRPTALAVQLAASSGVTLVGLLRGASANVHSHARRVVVR